MFLDALSIFVFYMLDGQSVCLSLLKVTLNDSEVTVGSGQLTVDRRQPTVYI